MLNNRDNRSVSLSPLERAAFGLYDLAWRVAVPFLRRNHRLAEGFEERTLQRPLPEAALWIQAASGGESYLTWEILRNLNPANPLTVLVTANTRQGVEILERAVADVSSENTALRIHVAYFPFDRPAIMERAVQQVRPRLMVLLETEIWPGLLNALKRDETRVLILNGRMSPKSLKGYARWPSVWRKLRPDRVLAVSPDYADRIARIFGRSCVGLMHNIKFDRIDVDAPVSEKDEGLKGILPEDSSFLVLGSIRQEEETPVEEVLLRVRRKAPETAIGLFPRHLHRLDHWQRRLESWSLPWQLRSEIKKPVPAGTVILWDTFGELAAAYGRAQAAFVGGSLAPMGGQNFLEPLTCGLIPVTGPSWYHFEWVGQEIFERGLVRVGPDQDAVAELLLEDLENPKPHREVRAAMKEYLKARQGGTAQACELIIRFLES